MCKFFPIVASKGSFHTVLFLTALCIVCMVPPSSARADEQGANELIGLSIEELLSVEVFSASKFSQKTVEAPANVSIITAADISNHGFRTLADIMASVRGFYVSNDRNYQYLGARGFNRPGDYNSRILLMWTATGSTIRFTTKLPSVTNSRWTWIWSNGWRSCAGRVRRSTAAMPSSR